MTGVGGQGMLAGDEVVSPLIVPRIWGVLAMRPEGLPALAAKVRPGGVVLGEVLPTHRRKIVDTNARCLARGAEYVATAGACVAAWT